jgi:short-subunit dehydrogenase
MSPSNSQSSNQSNESGGTIPSNDLARWLEWLNSVKLDLAIAAAGKSDRGYLCQLNINELRTIFEANVSTSFAFGQHCEESLSRSKGTLVHISSLAGIVAAPGMGAYSIAKHAVVALSRQLRLELASKGVRVLLVCPGPVSHSKPANSNHQGRYDDLVKQRELPSELAKPAAGNKVRSIDADTLAERILHAVDSGAKELIIPGKVRWLAALGTLFPRFADFMLKRNG